MSLTGLEVFDETLHKTNTWLKEIEQALGSNGAVRIRRCALYCTACAIAYRSMKWPSLATSSRYGPRHLL
jgi:hypothetical protein